MAERNEIWGIHWFRRDLRIAGNLSLLENHRRTKGRTLGLFCFDSKFLSREDFSHNRFAFFLETITALKKDLQSAGGDLLVIDCLPHEAFPKIFEKARKSELGAPALVSFGRDYEPFARKRDEDMKKLFAKEDVECVSLRDHLLFEPDEVLKDDGKFYRVYSPYARRWFDRLGSKEGKERLAVCFDKPEGRFKMKWTDVEHVPFKDSLEKFTKDNAKHVKVDIPKAGHAAGMARVDAFAKKIETYGAERDFPAAEATSFLSLFLKNGSITLPQVFDRLKLAGRRSAGRQKYAQELVWREFFYTILFHEPSVEGGPFNKKYEKLKWTGTPEQFDKWCKGQTGVPIVDAGMRELATKGWITNRMRIITATFMIKDLLLDWRKGELHFMHLLLDGDTANNNGNWQWCASTGAEAQPYFRVLNPWTQGERYDPDGDYIRMHVPELKDAPTDVLHDAEADRSKYGYPPPMVKHSEQRDRAIKMFK